uniref:Uncharacterized protein n=1 Tax=Echinococcus granulosus TaxID=6210 RepID=A0A068W7S2_ECHGR|nr:hypothetical protein EgrG_002017600 [Echinococcus granulosus]
MTLEDSPPPPPRPPPPPPVHISPGKSFNLPLRCPVSPSLSLSLPLPPPAFPVRAPLYPFFPSISPPHVRATEVTGRFVFQMQLPFRFLPYANEEGTDAKDLVANQLRTQCTDAVQ